MLHNGGSSGPGRSLILSKQTKKSQNEEQPAGQTKQNRAFLLAQSLDPPLKYGCPYLYDDQFFW